jgi:hypothetical protein
LFEVSELCSDALNDIGIEFLIIDLTEIKADAALRVSARERAIFAKANFKQLSVELTCQT